MPEILRAPRNRFHVFLFVVTFVNGVILMVGGRTSNAVDSALPGIGQRSFGFLLAAGTALVLFGLYYPTNGGPVSRHGEILVERAPTALLAKRAGYTALAFCTLIYAGAVIASNPDAGGFLTASVTLCFGLICGYEAWEINRAVKAVIADSGGGEP